MPGLGIPVDIERSEISDSLNGMLVQAFLMGMYTILYIATIYVYFARNSSQRFLVPATVSMLYLCNLVGFSVQWYNTKWEFINNGDTRDSVFESLYIVPNWFFVAEDTPAYIAFVLADGLLIWRCFFVWNRSIRVISVSLILVITEAALFFVEIIFDGKDGELVSEALSITLNALLSAAFFITFATTLVTTILIAYRIYSVSKQEGVSARRFKHIIDIVIQSGAVNSLTLLANAIIVVLPASILNTKDSAANTYAENIVPYVLAMSTTIMLIYQAFSSMLGPPQSDTEPAPDNAHPLDVHDLSDDEARRHSNASRKKEWRGISGALPGLCRGNDEKKFHAMEHAQMVRNKYPPAARSARSDGSDDHRLTARKLEHTAPASFAHTHERNEADASTRINAPRGVPALSLTNSLETIS
ncbi:hypothetical protein BJ912DRAFT_1079466 [Pholiota molesta]|nr:hypothetical protein BJ912DRAFT_1079466 [Pholiota molesta]